MISFEEIVGLYVSRKNLYSPYHFRAAKIRDQYKGMIAIPVLDKAEIPAVVDIVRQGIDHVGMRISSVLPTVWFALQNDTERSNKIATQSRQAILGMWEANRMARKMRRRGRHMAGYACSPVLIRPDLNRKLPVWEVKDPMSTFPSPSSDPDEIVPENTIFAFLRSGSWIKNNYAEGYKIDNLDKNYRSSNLDSSFTLLEYIDGDELVIGCCGRSDSLYGGSGYEGYVAIELDRIPNRTGRPWCVIPKRVNLTDQLQGQFDGLLGMFIKRAKLQALAYRAAQRGVQPETWIISRPGEVAHVIEEPEPEEGIYGQIEGAEIREMQVGNSVAIALQMSTQLEGAERSTSGTPVEFGGESTRGIQTGRRGLNVQAASVDMPIQEYQELLADGLVEENKIAIAQERVYWGNSTKTFYVGWKGAKGRLEYIPKRFWINDEHRVTYAFPGTDQSQLTVTAGQLVGMNTMSRESLMELHPLIDDKEVEKERIAREALEATLVAGIQAKAARGEYADIDIVEMIKQLSQNVSLADAVLAADKAARQRQAGENPVEPTSPEAQAGLASPGVTGAESATIPPPPQGLGNLFQLLGALRLPQRAAGARNA
jgi:hypothetical protein